MCTARLQAVGQAKPGLIRPSQAGQSQRPDHGFGWLEILESKAVGSGRGFWPKFLDEEGVQ